MAEQGEENIYTDNNTADPGETENDRKVKSAMGIQQTPLTSQSVDTSKEPTESGTDQSEDYTTADVRTPPTLPQPAYEHTAPTTLSEEIPHAPSHFEDEDSLPVTTEASGRGSRVTDSEDKGDWDVTTEPIQPESLLFIDDRGILRIYGHKIEWHAEGVPESEQIAQMIEKLIFAFHKQPSYREELKKMLGDAQTDNIWPDVPDNIDITIPLMPEITLKISS
ncbi:hypothetical protein EB796_024786 [Bugula neritina]|uniref:Uncharacterized protein n=1 Tax=Bugula neritina TaxID=10212 RepID=A0A7J7IU26_BUGNE|nr:hypothetical protein EB796_024786 [Bugula neritina]